MKEENEIHQSIRDNADMDPKPIDPSKPWPEWVDEDGTHVVNDEVVAQGLREEMERDQMKHEWKKEGRELEEAQSKEEQSDEPAETEEVPEINSEDDGDYEVFGSDEALVNHIVSVIQSLGKTATVHTDTANIKGGKTIVLCGNDWDAFIASCSANSGKNLVIQFNHDGARFRSTDAGIRCGTNIISYDLEELKSEVAQRALPML